MEIYLIKQFDNSFKLAGDSDLNKVRRIKPMDMVKCKITAPRNVKFHRKAFALFNLVFQNQEMYTDLEHLRKDLICTAGYYTERSNLHGEVIQEPKSISFAAMDEHEFNQFYDDIVNTIVKYFNFDKQAILDNVAQYF